MLDAALPVHYIRERGRAPIRSVLCNSQLVWFVYINILAALGTGCDALAWPRASSVWQCIYRVSHVIVDLPMMNFGHR